MAAQRQRLRLNRESTRSRPHRDDKILADWNGLMIAGLARAANLLDKPKWLEVAATAYASVRALLSDGDTLAHAARAGKLVRPGFASDHAAMAVAALALYGVGQWSVDCAWLKPRLDRWLTPRSTHSVSMN